MNENMKGFSFKKMPKYVILFLSLLLIAACGPKNAGYSEELRVIVGFEKGVSDERKEMIINELGMKKVRDLAWINAVACTYDGAGRYADLEHATQPYPEIRYIEPDFPVHAE